MGEVRLARDIRKIGNLEREALDNAIEQSGQKRLLGGEEVGQASLANVGLGSGALSQQNQSAAPRRRSWLMVFLRAKPLISDQLVFNCESRYFRML